MLFSKLVRIPSGPFATKNQENFRFVSAFSRAGAPFSVRQSQTSSFQSDKPCLICQDGQQLDKRTYLSEHINNPKPRLTVPLAITTSFYNWKYSSRAVILCQTRTLNTISTSQLTVRLDVSNNCAVRLLSSQNKDGNNSSKDGESDGTDSICKSPIKEVAIKDGFQTRDSVSDFLDHLTDDQKKLLYHSLNIEVLRDKYEGHLGSSASESHQFLSKFGRPAAALGGKEDPTGTLCEVSPKWLNARLDEKLRPPTAGAIWAVGVKNALPFIGFGFLDNLIMILAGDYIDITIGTTLGISTMAAAALGNTISDVAGIGSAWYIEEFASKIGIRDPELTPSQAASWPIRWACNGGRALGVVIGCLLGMVPLLFLPSSEDDKEKLAKSRAKRAEDAAKSSESPTKDNK